MYVSYSVSSFMYFGYCLYPAVNWISYFAVNSGFWCEEHHPLPRRWCLPGRTRGLLSILHVHGDRYTGIAALPPPHCVMQKISYLDFRKTWHSYEGKSTFFQITKPCHSSFARTWTQWSWVKNNMACFKCHVWITCNAACREDNFTSCSWRTAHRFRRRAYHGHGPNGVIYIDGYDKLKPFGISIHGAICGYSRKILWLQACPSKNDPRRVAHYYIDYLRDINGVPRLIRTDAGTENVEVQAIQFAPRLGHNDDMSGFRSVGIGRSTANQRIEMLWAILRRTMTQYRRNIFFRL